MSIRSLEYLERQENLISAAVEAEMKQHWFQAYRLWLTVGEKSAAALCEKILHYLAVSNLEKIPPKDFVLPDETWDNRLQLN